MSDLSLIRNITENSNIFHLINHTKLKKGVPDARYILKAKTLQIKFEWIYVIEKKLWIQLKKAKGLFNFYKNILTIIYFFALQKLR